MLYLSIECRNDNMSRTCSQFVDSSYKFKQVKNERDVDRLWSGVSD